MNRLYISDLIPGSKPGSFQPAILDAIASLGLTPTSGQYAWVITPEDPLTNPKCLVRIDLPNHAPLVALDATDDRFKMLPVAFPRDVKISAMGGASRRQLDRALAKLNLGTLLDDTEQTWGTAFTKIIRSIQPTFKQDDADAYLEINT